MIYNQIVTWTAFAILAMFVYWSINLKLFVVYLYTIWQLWSKKNCKIKEEVFWDTLVYMIRLRKTLSYSANRARTIRSKTQSWKTKMMSMTAKATSIAFDLLVQTVSWVLIARVSRLTVMSRFLRVAMRFDTNLDSVCC